MIIIGRAICAFDREPRARRARNNNGNGYQLETGRIPRSRHCFARRSVKIITHSRGANWRNLSGTAAVLPRRRRRHIVWSSDNRFDGCRAINFTVNAEIMDCNNNNNDNVVVMPCSRWKYILYTLSVTVLGNFFRGPFHNIVL